MSKGLGFVTASWLQPAALPQAASARVHVRLLIVLRNRQAASRPTCDNGLVGKGCQLCISRCTCGRCGCAWGSRRARRARCACKAAGVSACSASVKPCIARGRLETRKGPCCTVTITLQQAQLKVLCEQQLRACCWQSAVFAARHIFGLIADLGCQELLAGPPLWQWLWHWPEHEQEPAAQEGPRG